MSGVEVKISNTTRAYYLPGAVLRRLRMLLMVPNPEYASRVAIGKSTYGCPKVLTMYKLLPNNGIEVEYGATGLLFDELRQAGVDVEREVFCKECYGGNSLAIFPDEVRLVSLYDYQETAVKAMVDAHYGILQSKAGSGKTRMGIAMACRIGARTLWLTHTKDLLDQAYHAACAFVPKELLGRICNGKVALGRFITFATVQTMAKLDLSNDYRFEFNCVIVDECHRAAGSLNRVTMFAKVLNNLAAYYKFGLSATPKRGDGLFPMVESLIGRVQHRVPDDVVRVLPVRVCPIRTDFDADFADVCSEEGVLSFSKLVNAIVSDAERNALVAKAIKRLYEGGRSVLVLSHRVAHLENLAGVCGVPGRDVRVIHGKTKKVVRESALDDLRCGKARVLFASYSLAKEGLDVPALSGLVMATPIKDETAVIQSVGRVARVCDGKPEPVCVDFVDGRMRYLENMYKKRWTAYRKCDCLF